MVSFKKSIETALASVPFDGLVRFKKCFFAFCLAMKDLGITNEQENLQNILKEHHGVFQKRLLIWLKTQVAQALRGSFVAVEATNDSEFA
jgi:hypothetical protein